MSLTGCVPEKMKSDSFYHEAYGDNAQNVLEAMDWKHKATILLQKKKYKNALEALHLCLNMKRCAFDCNDTDIGITSMLLAQIYLKCQQFKEAKQYVKESIDIREKQNTADLILSHELQNTILRAERLALYDENYQKRNQNQTKQTETSGQNKQKYLQIIMKCLMFLSVVVAICAYVFA